MTLASNHFALFVRGPRNGLRVRQRLDTVTPDGFAPNWNPVET